ncbi:site-specific integrase [Jiella sonneratiae]|uniref:Site-specific integrase n=1 Tax=Jiella sonneratiae TaxID=2816856 RepID=A0ABS3IZ55_9HYPH|nr:site-specific integrase [Jiella sonneratiae]MBO0902700.1 site-specific integrase [Jiella sonneratiae]
MPDTDNGDLGGGEIQTAAEGNPLNCHPDYGTHIVADVRVHRPDRVLVNGRQVVVRLERTIPLLFIRGVDGEAILVREVLEWLWKLDGMGRKDLRQKASALGLLYEYSVKVAGWGLWDAVEADLLVHNFLACRLGMEQAREVEAQALPLWRPVCLDVARQDFNAVREFASFSRSIEGPMSWLGEQLSRSADFDFPRRRRHEALDDWLSHLEPFRARFKELAAPDPAFPSHFKSPLRPSGHSTKGDLKRVQVDELVDEEPNLVFRALWLLLAFGGIRVAEGLNVWNADVMPGHMSKFFGSSDMTGTPLVLLAHPTNSRYIDNPSASARSGPTRRTVLERKYGLVARPLLPKKDGLYAGWKGLVPYEGRNGDGFVYWIDPDRAKQFERLVGRIRDIRLMSGAGLRHPYLFVNGVDPETRGDPLRIKNVEAAFRRAVDRVGLTVGRSIPSVHWLRHFYKARAKHELGLSDHDIQIMMHHASIVSQEEYGRRALNLHETLSRLFGAFYAA